VSWAQDGLEVVQRQEAAFASERPTTLPAMLGKGFTVNTPGAITGRPYYTIATFRCGATSPWLRIDLARVIQGRDRIKDMISLMRIAEQRFGLLHHCAPKPLDGA
jgi:hypothetical protein